MAIMATSLSMRATNRSSQLTFNWDDLPPENEVVSAVSTSDFSTGSRAASGDSASDLEAAAFGGAERLPLDFPCDPTPANNGNDAQSLENEMEQTTQSKIAYGFVRPERQTDFGGLTQYEWPAPKQDRDLITVDRIRADIDGPAHRFTIMRGDVVEVFLGSSEVELGEVIDISHARQEVAVRFSVGGDGIWFDKGQIYPAPLDEEEAFLTGPINQTVEASHRQHYPDNGLAMSENAPAYGEKLAVNFTMDDYKHFRSRLSDQTLEIEELHAAFNSMLQAEEAFLSDLKSRFNATRMQNVARNLGKFGGRTKQENAQSIYDALLRSFYLKDSFSYSPLQQSFKERLSELVPSQTADDLKSYYEARTKAQEAEQKIVENPESLSEFRELIRLKGIGQLTEQQLETYDRLAAQQSRKQRADAKPTQVSKFESEGLSESSFTIKQGYHDKKGCPLWIVQLTERVERDVYNELNRKAKMLGGWFSSFRKADAGFQFISEDSALKFAALLNSDADRTEELEGRKAHREQTAAERLSEVASRLLENAKQVLLDDESKLKNTARRAGMAAGMRGRAYAEIALAKTVQSIADSMSRGEAEFLDGIRAKTQVETLNAIWRSAKQDQLSVLFREAEEADRPLTYDQRELERDRLPNLSDVPFVALPYPTVHNRNVLDVLTVAAGRSGCVQISKRLAKILKSTKSGEIFEFKRPHEIELYQEFVDRAKSAGIEVRWLESSLEDWKRLRAANIHTIEELRAAIRELAGHQAERLADNPITKAEDSLRGKRLPGFFPTPRPVINRMLELVQLKGSERVLEPSCGKGDILDAITEQFPEADVTGIEINRSLQEILEAKGYEIEFEDFLDHQGQYDCVVMNPPFEDGQEIKHVRHAFSLLAPGGRLVSVMSEGPFFRSDANSIAFRAWLDEVGAETESLPQNAFRGSEAFRETGVSTRLVSIRK
jgi:hypothetical protein